MCFQVAATRPLLLVKIAAIRLYGKVNMEFHIKASLEPTISDHCQLALTEKLIAMWNTHRRILARLRQLYLLIFCKMAGAVKESLVPKGSYQSTLPKLVLATV